MGHRRPRPACKSSQLIRRAPFSRWQSTLECHGGGQEQRQPLASSQAGPGVGSQTPARASLCPWHTRARHVRVCALPVPASRPYPSVHPSKTVCAHTCSHLCPPNTPPRTHVMHTHPLTHTHAHAHTPLTHTHTITHSCAHTHACAHCHVGILQVVLRGAWHSSFSGGRTTPPGLQDTKEPHHMPTVPGTSTQFRRLFSSGRVLTVPFSS